MEISRPLSAVPARTAIAAYQRPRKLPWGTIMLHAVIIFFCLIIILPIAWVILRSITPIPDAYTGQLWPSPDARGRRDTRPRQLWPGPDPRGRGDTRPR